MDRPLFRPSNEQPLGWRKVKQQRRLAVLSISLTRSITMLRGDDDLFSLMEEMGNDGGAEKSGEKCGKKKKKRTRDDDASRPTNSSTTSVRLLPEVEGYGHTLSSTTITTVVSASSEIWNPYVHVALSPRASDGLDIVVPTNPHVEILRRRAYEKFKRGFYAIFQSTAESARAAEGDAKLHEMKRADRAGAGGSNPSGKGNIDNQKRKEDRTILNQTWGELPSHSILERWHFAAKVEEDMLARECRSSSSSKVEQEASPTLSASISGNKSTAIIRDAIVMNRRNGTSVDPILINLPQKSQQRQDSPPTNLLKEEIVFQWKRERRRKVGIAAGNAKLASRDLDTVEDELDRILGSQKFTRRVGGITGAVKDLAREVESDFIKELGRRASQEASSHAASSTSGGKKKKKRDKSIPKISFGDNNGSHDLSKSQEITVAYSGLSLKINETHYEKLQILFDRFNTDSTSIPDHRDRFASALFALLCRYDMLEGGGLQSSLVGDVFDLLLNRFDCRTECFASPFNCRYERFCSAFPDTDAAFGSLGSFFDFDPTLKSGCFQANPPFISGFIEMMERRMDGHLESTSGKPLMFIVFIPAWKETTGWKALNVSPHLTKHLLLSQKTDPHFYCEGTQHRRRGRYRIATFDTSVFFLQNSKARDKWPVTDEIVEELTMAFRRNPDEDGSEKANERAAAVAVGAKANDEPRSKKKKKKEFRKEEKTRKAEEVQQKGMGGIPKGGKRKSEKSKKKKLKLVEDGERKQMEILSSILSGAES